MSIIKTVIIGAVIPVVLTLTACTSDKYQLTSAGQKVEFIDELPASNCQNLGKTEGHVNTFFSGTQTHSELMKYAAIDLLNNVAAKGGNIIYNAQDASMKYVSEILPTDAVMEGEAYRCP